MRPIVLSLIFLFSSCAGYQVVKNDNPFKVYGVRSVSVPVFVNRSLLPTISGPMTSEVISMLREYPNLHVFSGDNNKSDAVLLGIIESADKWEDFLDTTGVALTDGDLKQSIGERNPFNMTLSSSLSLKVRFVLIKSVKKEDLDLLTSSLAEKIGASKKIIFNETIDLSQSFQRVLKASTELSDSPGKVNLTKNSFILKKTSKDLAILGARKIKEEVFNAF